MAAADVPWHRSYQQGVPRSLEYPPVTLPAFLAEAADRYPANAAAVFMGGRLSYRRLNELADRFAAALAGLSVRPGERVAIHLPNCPQFVIAFYGALRAGAVAVPVNPLYRGDDLAFILRDAGARVIVTLTKLYPHVREVRGDTPLDRVIVTGIKEYLPWKLRLLFSLFKEKKEGHAFPRGEDVIPFASLLARYRAATASPGGPGGGAGPDDVAVLQYTGGTTGVPKGAMLSHRNLVANAMQVESWLPTIEKGKEVIAAALPFFHVFGLTATMNLTIRIGGTAVMFPQFNPREVLEGAAGHRVTIFPGVPAMYVAMQHLKGFERVSGGRLVEGYGLTEASPVTHVNPLEGVEKVGSIGIPLPDTEARIVDMEDGTRTLPPGEEGELVIRGPQVMRGYWNQPEETRAAIRDGWLHTGDVARMDEDGYFFIVDRKKDMVIVGGFNVYPREIEDLLYKHPKVKEAAVVGVSHPVRGETLAAYVVPKEGEELTPGEIGGFCRERLAPYKVPRRVRIVDAIPKTLVGKPLRRVIREREAAGD